jgi:uncharacterized protein YjbI with pentapeptide repeats
MKKRTIIRVVELSLLAFLSLICISAAIAFSRDHGKTLWDWLDLLIVPVALALGAWWINRVSEKNEQKRANRENEIEREIAADRIRESALQTYLDRMAELLFERNLRNLQPNGEVRTVARARTLTVLQSLDGVRKGTVVRFLYEAGLITVKQQSGIVETTATIVDLSDANLMDADLSGSTLNKANLSRVRLGRANLGAAKLNGAELSEAALGDADLSYTELNNAKLGGAFLIGATLIYAQMRNADMSRAFLTQADLSDAFLMDADLSGTHLERARLNGAILIRANLKGTDLSGADLSEVTVTPEQLSQAASLKGAIMPDGTKHD